MTENASFRAARRLFIALDFPSAEKALIMARRLAPLGVGSKVGLELYTAEGPSLLRTLSHWATRSPIFLDLKFHDIPATVAGAMRSASRLGVDMLNLHLSGGEAMVREAVKARDEIVRMDSGDRESALAMGNTERLWSVRGQQNLEREKEPPDLVAGAELEQAEREEPKPHIVEAPLLIGVTMLTSLDGDDLRSVWGEQIGRDASTHVLRMAERALDWGLDGVVASAREAAAIRKACGSDFLIVTPGIRPAGADRGDQKRVLTPAAALEAGASHLVVGRPVTRAVDPFAACQAILTEMSKVLT